MIAKEILTERYYHADSRSRGNEIVRQFIIDKQLIVTGGLVIDYAIKLTGDKGIYEDYEVPDYDFFSTDNARDASDLFKILMKAGFSNISLLPGIHPSTVKVFVFKDCIADITYASKSLFKEMEKTAFTYNGMRIRNPYFQFADMHRALTYPYENEPRETINNRWEKDLLRFVKLYSAWKDNSKDAIKDLNSTGITDINLTGVIAGKTAISFYLNNNSHVRILDYVYLMTDSDYKEFITDNGKYINEMRQYKSYQELLPERTEMLYKGKSLTILHCRNKTSVYFPKLQSEKQNEMLKNAKLRIASVTTIPLEPTIVSAIRSTDRILASLNFCIIYSFSMFQVTGDKWYDSAYNRLLELAYNAYNSLQTDLFPSIITYGVELPSPIIVYTTDHPEAKVPQVHIKSEDDEDVIAEQLAKLPYDFKYDPSIYQLDGKTKN